VGGRRLRLGTDGSLSLVDAPRAQVGSVPDPRASTFRLLVEPVLDDAYRRATVMLANRTEAEDAVHDAAERAWRSFASLRNPDQFEAWFGRILLNVCRDRLRKRRRVALVEVDGQLVEREDGASTAALRSIDERERVLDALAELSADQRIAVVLRYESDLTIPEIARLTRTRQGTVKARLHHALRRLHRRLAEDQL
jgi:RNA polymerase sigma-70 factor (ECF subfamily)